MNKLFFELIRVALGNAVCLSHTPKIKEWQMLYEMAKKQSLVGICFAGVQKLTINHSSLNVNLSESLRLQWMGLAAKIQQRNEVVNRQCAELQAILSADGLRLCILKGQGVARCYPETLRGLRQSGDIDVWVNGGVDAVVRFVSKYERIEKLDNKHLHCHCFSDTDVELHWTPVCWYSSPKNKILQAYFDSERERQFGNVVDGLCVPTADFQLVHQLLHVYGHYVYEGVGMRQVMDLYFAQRACLEGSYGSSFGSAQEPNSLSCSEGFEKVRDLVKTIGLMKYLAGTQWVLKNVFSMPDGVLLCEPDEKEGKKLLDEIMIGGNFGHYDKRSQVVNENMLHRFMSRWKRKFCMIRFDPVGTIMMPYYRIKLEFWMRGIRRQYNL